MKKNILNYDILDAEYFAPFPPPYGIDDEGLLCQGGNLDVDILIYAYTRGIFPWYSEDTPILWWSPNPRWVLYPENFHISKRSARKLRNCPFRLSVNKAFKDVIINCAKLRAKETWLIEEMIEAYINLHELGYAHSVEAWREGRLVGGLYGLALGSAFFGESMFHVETEASRAALCGLVNILKKKKFDFIDCQQESRHMIKMGAEPIQRKDFIKMVKKSVFNNKNPYVLENIKSALQGQLEYDINKDEWV